MWSGAKGSLKRHRFFFYAWLIYAAFLIGSLPDYGVTWDVYLEFPRATALVDHFLPERAGGEIPSPWKGLSYEAASSRNFMAQNAMLPSIIAALSGKLFFEYLHVLGPIDAYHLGLVLLWLCALLYMYQRLTQLHSRDMALCSMLFLMLAPRVLGHVPNNMKDVPAMAFVAMAVLDVACALRLGRPGLLAVAGLFFGAALSSKLTAGIGLLPIAVLLVVRLKQGGLPRRYWLPLASAPVLALAVFVGHWPYLWVPPVELWHRLVEWRSVIAIRSGSHSLSLYPAVLLFVTTPVPTLLAGLGSVVPLWRWIGVEDRGLFFAYLLWFLGILGAFSSGMIALFDGIRHFLHVWPPLAFLAGWGVSMLSARLFARAPRMAPFRLQITALALVVLLVPSVLLYHPYEVTYFNALIGGLPGATTLRFDPDRVLDFEARDYWGTSVRRAVRWANANLPENAVVSVSLPPRAQIAYPYRSDFRMALTEVGVTEYLILLNRPLWFREADSLALSTGEILHQEEARGVPLTFVIRMPRSN